MKSKKKSRLISLLLAVLFFAIFVALYSISNARVVKIAESSYSGVLSTASYYAIEKTFDKNYEYESLFTIHKNDNGEIKMITSDAYKFNIITSTIANYVSEYMLSYSNKGVEVPIGVFSGIRLLQGFGKKINMKVIAINSVKCDIISTFESAGINQTRHTLYLAVTPDVSVVTRFTTKKLVDKITVMLYDNVIIGSVPEIYLAGSVFSAYKSS